MVLFSELTVWHLGYIPLVGCFVAALLYVVFRIVPQGKPPQYILELEEKAIIGGRMAMIAEEAAEELSQTPPDPPPSPKPIYRESVTNEVMDEYNAYKRKVGAVGGQPKGLASWLRSFDPDLARRLFDED